MEDIENKIFNDINKYLKRTALSICNENRNTEFNNSYYEEYSYNTNINANKINDMLLNKITNLDLIYTGINNSNHCYYYYLYKGEYYKFTYLLSTICISIYSKI